MKRAPKRKRKRKRKTKSPNEAAPGAVETIRRRIREFLESGPRTLRDISQELRISEKEALDHLEHIALAKGAGRLAVEPSECNACGYVFNKRSRLGKPGRCPVCKSESISRPRYYIK